MSARAETVAAGGRELAISNPDEVLFPLPRYTKRDLVHYYRAVAGGALRGAGGRPNMQGFQLLRQPRARLHRERRRHADVMQHAAIVVQAEQQRTDDPLALLCQRKPRWF